MQLKSRTASQESKGETLQKLKSCTAAENTEALKAVHKLAQTEETKGYAARNEEAAAAM